MLKSQISHVKIFCLVNIDGNTIYWQEPVHGPLITVFGAFLLRYIIKYEKPRSSFQLIVCACSHVTSCPVVLCPIEIRQKYVNCAFSSYHYLCGIASKLTQGVTIIISSGKNWTECLTTFCLSFSQPFLNIFLTRVLSKLYLFLGWWSSSFLIKTNQIPTHS